MSLATLDRRRRLGLALLAGFGFSLAFQALAMPWLAAVGLAPLLLLLRAPKPFWTGWAFGVGYWLGAMPWIVGTLEDYGGAPPGLSHGLMLALAFYLGLDSALFAWLAAKIWNNDGPGRTAWRLAAIPALWVCVESIRGFPFNGFPWNLAAYAWTDLPGALPLAAWIGAFGVSALVVLANVAVADACERRNVDSYRSPWRRSLGVWLAITLALGLAGRFGGGEGLVGGAFAAKATASSPGQLLAPPDAEIRIIQPNSPIARDGDEILANYQTLISMSRAECAPGVLLMWPESAAWPMLYGRAPRLQEDLDALRAAGCRVLFNSAEETAEGWLNTVLLYGPGGIEGRYAKRRLVPFGEYVPLGTVLPFIGYLARNAGEFLPGRDLGLLPWGGSTLAPAICYEVVFPGPVAEQVRAGAGVLVTVTNDAWYGDSSAPWQHLRAARFRAAENGRPLLRAALTGVSAIVDARGALVAQLGVGERGVLRAKVAPGKRLTPFTRAPWLFPTLAALVAAFAIIRQRSGAVGRP